MKPKNVMRIHPARTTVLGLLLVTEAGYAQERLGTNAAPLAAEEPQKKWPSRRFASPVFWSRLANVLVGCGVGSCLLLLGPQSEWLIPLALAATVLISTYLVRIKTMWRQAPNTAAVVIAGIAGSSKVVGLERGLHKVAEVVFGCLVGIAVSWLASKVWLVQPKPT
jgi:uncharacterized membrane protein YccC